MGRAARPNERERMSQSVLGGSEIGDHMGARGKASQLSDISYRLIVKGHCVGRKDWSPIPAVQRSAL
jgi:hypothetical protein